VEILFRVFIGEVDGAVPSEENFLHKLRTIVFYSAKFLLKLGFNEQAEKLFKCLFIMKVDGK